MNKIYKIIWSKVKNCYVVVSELAKNHVKSSRLKIINRNFIVSVLSFLISCGAVMPVEAVTGNYSAGGGSATDDYGISIGNSAKSQSVRGISLGLKANSQTDDTIAIGSCSVAGHRYDQTRAGLYAIAVGTYAFSGGQWNIAMGMQSFAGYTSSKSIAIGGSIGNNSSNTSSIDGAVALGYCSVANVSNVVSVGHAKNDTYVTSNGSTGTTSTYSNDYFRRIINVANGTGAHDAATYGQVSGAIKGLSVSGKTITYTKIDGTTGTITTQDNNTTYSAATSSTLGLVKTGSNITNSSGTISLTKANVTSALGYTPPTTDTNTHYTTHLYAGSGTAANAATTNGNTKIALADDSTVRNTLTIKGTGATTVTSDASGVITINSTDNNTTYSAATQSANGLMSAADKKKLDGIATGANAYTLPAATSSALGGVKVGSNITNSSGTISLTKANVVAALGYTPPTTDTNTTYSAFTGASSSAAGSAGLVKAPAAGDQAKFLRGDGTWAADNDTHWTSHMYVGSGTAANAATTNGNTKIALADNSTVRNTLTIKGTGATTVVSDANGVITINSTDNNTTYSALSASEATTGTATTARTITAKVLADYVGDKVTTAKNGTITDLSISGKTITYTKGDGSTGNLTTQDTTYTAGNGLSLSGGKFSVNTNGQVVSGNTGIVTGGAVYDAIESRFGQSTVSQGTEGAVALGDNTSVSADGSVAIGNCSNVSGESSVAVGDTSSATGDGAVAFGGGTNAGGDNSVAVGNDSSASAEGSVALGGGTTSGGTDSVAVGTNSTASADGSVALGGNTNAEGVNSIAVGNDSSSSAQGAIALGNKTDAEGENSVAVGTNSSASADGSVALGGNTVADGINSVAVGSDSSASAEGAIAIGNATSAVGENSIALGNESIASQEGSTAIGGGSSVSGIHSTAIGNNTYVISDSSVALGYDSNASENNVISIGHKATDLDADGQPYGSDLTRRIVNVAPGTSSTDVATVGQTFVLQDGVHTTVVDSGTNEIGQHIYKMTVKTDGEVVSGNTDIVTGGTVYDAIEARLGTSLISNGTENAVALGDGSSVSGDGAIAVGSGSSGDAEGSIAIGNTSISSGEGSVAIGGTSNSSGDGSVAVGSDSTSSGEGSVAVGNTSTSSGDGSVAIGNDTSAESLNTIAIGNGSTISGTESNNSVAIGQQTSITGTDSVALGGGSSVIAKESVALGSNTIVTSDSSVALGYGSNASQDNVISVGHSATDLDANGQPYGSDLNRRIVNVADAVDDHDAVTKGQLDTIITNNVGVLSSDGSFILKDNSTSANLESLDTQLTTLTNTTVGYSSDNKDSIIYEGERGTTLRNVKGGAINESSMEAVNGSQLYAVKQDIVGFAEDISRSSENIKSLNSSVSSALASVAASSLLVDTLDLSKANISLDNLSDTGKQVLRSYAETAVQDYLSSQNLSSPIAPMAVQVSNGNTLSITDAGNGSLHVGEGSSVNGSSSIAIGVGNQVNANNSGAFGDPSIIDADASYILGNDDRITPVAKGSFVVGNDSKADAEGSLIIGSNSVSNGKNGLALGNNTVVNADNAVAIGTGSDATEENVVSVGNASLQRRIVNVADGMIAEDSHDAVTGGQIFIIDEKVKDNTAKIEKKADADASNVIVSDWSAKLGIGKVEDGNSDVVTGGTVYDAIKGISNSDLIQSNDDKITIGSNNAATVIDVTNSNGEGRTITGIVTDINDASSAANVGYVNQVSENIVNATNRAFQQVDNKINKVGANAAAIANLPTPTFDGEEKWAFAAGVGHYQGETAGAVGAFYKATDNVIARVSGSFGNGDEMVGAGIAVSLNKGNTPAVSKAQLVRTINAQAERINNMEASHRAEREADRNAIATQNEMIQNQANEIAELKAMVADLAAKVN